MHTYLNIDSKITVDWLVAWGMGLVGLLKVQSKLHISNVNHPLKDFSDCKLKHHVPVLSDHWELGYFQLFIIVQDQHCCVWHLKMILLRNVWHSKCYDVQQAKNGALSAESVEVLIAWHLSVNSTDISFTPYYMWIYIFII